MAAESFSAWDTGTSGMQRAGSEHNLLVSGMWLWCPIVRRDGTALEDNRASITECGLSIREALKGSTAGDLLAGGKTLE